ncbi:nucleotidyltransferase domain-containing protein [Cyanobium sp. ATX-6F1]
MPADLDLGPGLDPDRLLQALQRLALAPGVLALVAFGSRGRGDAWPDSDLDLAVICREGTLTSSTKAERWYAYRQTLGPLGCGVDLVVVGFEDAGRLAGSRWHVLGDVAREGQVLYVSG